jgi:hypothetical protein
MSAKSSAALSDVRKLISKAGGDKMLNSEEKGMKLPRIKEVINITFRL